jgi:hypothetical protein
MRAAGPRRQRHVPLHRPSAIGVLNPSTVGPLSNRPVRPTVGREAHCAPRRRPTHAAPGSYPGVWTVSKVAAVASGAPIIDAKQLDGYPTRTHGQAPDTFKVVDVHGAEVEVTASPPNLRLGERGGSASLFDAKVDGAVATIVEAAETWDKTLWIHTVGWSPGGRTVSGPPVDVVRSAGAAVVAEIQAEGYGSEPGVVSQRIFAARSSTTRPLGWHADVLRGKFRTVHVTRDSPPSDVGFGVGPVDMKNKPTKAGTLIAGVDLSGFVCAATERIAPGETYLLDREGAGDVCWPSPQLPGHVALIFVAPGHAGCVESVAETRVVATSFDRRRRSCYLLLESNWRAARRSSCHSSASTPCYPSSASGVPW